jgi:hypothetical protein
MLKYLECPDLHVKKNWKETSIKIFKQIKKSAIEQSVDFIAFPGDLMDDVFTNSDEGGIDFLISSIKDLLTVCPLVAVEGTPGHDAAGSYRVLEELGLTLLRPGKVYGYWNQKEEYADPFRNNIVKEVTGNEIRTPNAILFGIPELNKKNIHAKLNLTGDQANAEAVESLGRYIDSFIAPMRLKYADIPAIGLIHGNVSDSKKEHQTDVILKNSDIIIHTEILERANLDRWSGGHLHGPWESSCISFGYAGFAGIDVNPWGKRNFLPAMNLVKISKGLKVTYKTKKEAFIPHISRIPYGTPERLKFTGSIPEGVDVTGKAVWLVADDPKAALPEGVHEWSRITFAENRQETRRVTEEQREEAKTLYDLSVLCDPETPKSTKDKFDSLIESKKFHKPVNVRLNRLEVTGSHKFFKGRRVVFDLTQLENGLNKICGENGDGKSSLLAFCSPYPMAIGKDNISGRDSALKDFFNSKDSCIEKWLTVNGELHHHKITISAHRKNPKLECYLDIAGTPQLENTSFDTMKAKCEELYGSFDDYKITTFYEQPQQSIKGNTSGLMSASMTQARDIVHEIAGIDRAYEKSQADAIVNDLKKKTEEAAIRIDEKKKALPDEAAIEHDRVNKGMALELIESSLKDRATAMGIIDDAIDDLQKKKIIEEAKKKEKGRSVEIKAQVSALNGLMKSSLSIKDKLDSHSLAVKSVADAEEKNRNISDTNKDLALKHSQEIQAWHAEKSEIDHINNKLKEEVRSRNEAANEAYNNELAKYHLAEKEANNKIGEIKLQHSKSLQVWESEKSKIDQHNNNLKEAVRTINQAVMDAYNRSMESYYKAVQNVSSERGRVSGIVSANEMAIKNNLSMIDSLNNPCEFCGKTASEARDSIDKHLKQNIDFEAANKDYNKILQDLKPPIEPIKPIPEMLDTSKLLGYPEDPKAPEINIVMPERPIQPFPESVNPSDLMSYPEEPKAPALSSLLPIDRSGILPAFEVSALEENLKKSKTALDEIEKLENELARLDAILIDESVYQRLEDAAKRRVICQGKIDEEKEMVASLKAEINVLLSRIEEVRSKAAEIAQLEKSTESQKKELEDWKFVSMMLGSNKIPALELELFADSIDAEAARNIYPFLEGRYRYRTITQSQGKDGLVDRFDILLTDNETGEEFSLFFTNPGNKALYSDCYIKALTRLRNEKAHKNYSPIIFDESDGAISPKRAPMYWRIQSDYYAGSKNQVLVVSQKEAADNFIQNKIQMEDLKV